MAQDRHEHNNEISNRIIPRIPELMKKLENGETPEELNDLSIQADWKLPTRGCYSELQANARKGLSCKSMSLSWMKSEALRFIPITNSAL
jgi:hypothetical protein